MLNVKGIELLIRKKVSMVGAKNKKSLLLLSSCLNLSLIAAGKTPPARDSKPQKVENIKDSSEVKTSATASNLDAEVRKIQELITKQKDSFCANFVQFIYKDIRKESLKKEGDIVYSVKREGKFIFKRPHKFRFSFLKPMDSELLYDGKLIYSIQIQDDGKKTATSYSLDSARAQETKRLVDLILNFGKLSQEYKIISLERVTEKAKLVLEPLSKVEISKIEISVDLKAGYINFLKISYPRTENSSTFLFTKINEEVKEDAFNLPKDLKIDSLN